MTGTHTGSRTTGLDTTDSDGSKASDVKAAVGSATDTAKDKATEQVGKVVDKADSRRSELADQARTIQEKAQEFASSVAQEQPQIGHALEQVVDSANRLISYVEETPVEQMKDDVTLQMRRHPMLFAAGMFGAGFAFTRAFKPVDRSSLTTGSTGPRQLGSTSSASTYDTTTTQPLPAASAVDGGMH